MDTVQSFKLFVRIVNLGSFSKAAAEIGISQSSATKRIALLESRLGSRLLHRSTHGVKPTEIGLLFYEKCKLISFHIDEVDSAVALMQSNLQGRLRINTSVAFGRRVLAPLIIKFMRLHPHLNIDLNFDDHYVNLIEQGVDIAIRMGHLADSTLGSRYLGVNPWVLVAAPSYLSKHHKPISPQDISHHNALIYSTAQGDGKWIFKSSKRPSPETIVVRGTLRSNNLSTLLAATRAGMGVAALPRYVAHESIKTHALQIILPDWSLPSQEIHAVFPSPRLVPKKVSHFTSWLQQEIAPNWWEEIHALNNTL